MQSRMQPISTAARAISWQRHRAAIPSAVSGGGVSSATTYPNCPAFARLGCPMSRLGMLAAVSLFAAFLTGCATNRQADSIVVPLPPGLSEFSVARPGDELPGGWRVWTLSRFKKPTQYRLVADAGRTVVNARADASASGLIHDVSV